MRIVYLFILSSFVSLSLISQSDLERKASRALYKFDYAAAAEVYEEMLKNNPENKTAKVNAANAYLAEGNTERAEYWFEQLAKTKGAAPSYKFNYAQTLMANKKYEEAEKAFEDFAASAPNDTRAKFYKNNPKYIETLIKASPKFMISNAKALNSRYSDMCAVPFNDGVMFSTTRSSNMNAPIYDMFFAKVTSDSIYSDVASMSRYVNTGLHDGPAIVSPDGATMYLTRSFQKAGSCVCSNDKTNHLKIFSSPVSFGEAKKFEEMALVEPSYSVGHMAISPDGTMMIFASNQPGGFGETDLWMTSKKTGEWSKPVNLGKEVNTPGRELFPFIGNDGTLYWASDGRIGLGGLDIYSATIHDQRFTNIVNLGMPINSTYDDFGLSLNINGKSGYITSNREGGEGDDDIYSIYKADKMPFETIVYDVVSNEELVDAQVELINNTKKTIEIGKTDDFGVTRFLIDGNTSYRLKTKKDGYIAKEISFKTMSIVQEKQVVRIPLRREGGIMLEVIVKDNYDQFVAGAGVSATPKDGGKKMIGSTDPSGKATIVLEVDKVYAIRIIKSTADEKVSYSAAKGELNTSGKTPPFTFYQTYKLNKFEEGAITEIKNIYYDSKSSAINPTLMKELDKLVKFLQRYPKMEIEIRSHTDSRGDDEENLVLSKERASKVQAYLVYKGIEERRIKAEGYGERELKNRCGNGELCSESQHQENRRTEFKMLKVK